MTNDFLNFDDPNYDYMLGGDAGSSGFDLSGLAMGLNIAGTLGKSYGALMVGKEKAAADEYNAALVRQEEQYTEYQIGEEEVAMASTQRAMFAKAGVTQSGSALDTMLHTATQYELTKQVTKYNAESKARMYEYQAAVAKQQGQFGAGMNLLQGAASLAMAFI